MKKIYSILAVLLFCGAVFSQTTKSGNTLSAVKVLKEINNLPSNQGKPVVDSLRYDGPNADGIGTNGAVTFGVYAYFPAATLAPHATANRYILSVKVYVNGVTNVSAIQLRFYSNTGTTLLYSQTFTPIEGWNDVVLTTPFAVPSTGNLYIGYNLTATGGFPAGCDAGPANVNGNWIDFGGVWQHLTDLDATLIFNWNIRAMVGTLPTAPVATCTPLSWSPTNTLINTTVTSSNFTLSNAGTGTLTCSGITGLSAPFTTTLVPANVSLTTGATSTFTISYNPLAVGTHTQTAVIATNGGNITINLSGNAVSCAPITALPWIESYEAAVFPPACWSKSNVGGGTGWASINSGTTPLPGWQGGTMTVPTGGGTKAAYCTWNTGGATANDQWLISPQISVPTNGQLNFQVFWFGHFKDFLDVKISTSTNAIASFTTNLLAIDTFQLIHNAWKPFTISLASYAGSDVYIAFNEHVTDNTADGAFIGLDMVMVDVAVGLSEYDDNSITVYPNPAQDKLFINAPQKANIEIYNLVGEKIGMYENENMINISDYIPGVYFVKIVAEGKSVTKKINIQR